MSIPAAVGRIAVALVLLASAAAPQPLAAVLVGLSLVLLALPDRAWRW